METQKDREVQEEGAGGRCRRKVQNGKEEAKKAL